MLTETCVHLTSIFPVTNLQSWMLGVEEEKDEKEEEEEDKEEEDEEGVL